MFPILALFFCPRACARYNAVDVAIDYTPISHNISISSSPVPAKPTSVKAGDTHLSGMLGPDDNKPQLFLQSRPRYGYGEDRAPLGTESDGLEDDVGGIGVSEGGEE